MEKHAASERQKSEQWKKWERERGPHTDKIKLLLRAAPAKWFLLVLPDFSFLFSIGETLSRTNKHTHWLDFVLISTQSTKPFLYRYRNIKDSLTRYKFCALLAGPLVKRILLFSFPFHPLLRYSLLLLSFAQSFDSHTSAGHEFQGLDKDKDKNKNSKETDWLIIKNSNWFAR